MSRPLQLFARVQSLTCCRGCERQVVTCPTCGQHWHRVGRNNREAAITCPCAPGVETLITVEWAGYVPNPTGEAPPPVLSGDLQRLERAWQRPPADRAAWSMPPQSRPTMEELRRQVGAPPSVAHRHQPPAVAAPPPRAPQQRPRPRKLLDLIRRDPSLSPCPPEAHRRTLAQWERPYPGGPRWLPGTFAGAFRRLFGAEPRYGRGALNQTRVYSSREAAAVIRALGLAAATAQQGGRP